jgi:hypothetical protein
VLALKAAYAVLAKAAKEDATKACDAATLDVINGLLDAGIESITTQDGTVVTLKGGLDGEVRRTVNVDSLAERVPAATLDRVTKRSVDLSAFDAAVEVGLIDAATVAAVTSETPVKRSIKITPPIKR